MYKPCIKKVICGYVIYYISSTLVMTKQVLNFCFLGEIVCNPKEKIVHCPTSNLHYSETNNDYPKHILRFMYDHVGKHYSPFAKHSRHSPSISWLMPGTTTLIRKGEVLAELCL